jgi:acyl carrier protein
MIARLVIRKTTSIEKVKATMFDLLRKNDKVNYGQLNSGSSFKDIGLNSLDTVELIVDMEEELKVELRNDEVVSISTCEQAIKIFTDHVDKKFYI